MVSWLKKIFLGNFTIAISSFLILSINILLLFFPLTNVFGFEFSFVNATVISFLSGIVSISLFKKADNPKYFISIKHLIVIGVIFLSIPLIVSVSNSLIGLACSLKDGFNFYIVLVIPSYLIGVTFGLITYSLSKKFSYFIFFLLFLLILFIPIFEFYFNPQIYFYNAIFGLFPGTIYDEGLSVDLKLVFYRSINLIFFSVVFFIMYKNYRTNRASIWNKLVVVLSFFVALIFLFLSPLFGFSTTKSSLSNHLNKKIVTENFIIHFSKKINERKMKTIVLRHEYYYSKLTKYFKVERTEKIESFVFKNNLQKGKLFGSANADVAKPWLNQIYTTQDSYDNTLEHEIAHIISASFGKGIFKVADGLNPSLIEGVAVAGSPFYDNNPIDYMASLAWNNGYKVHIDYLFESLSFFGQTSALSYIYAGSFSKYLIDNYGVQKFKLFYKNVDFRNIYKQQFKKVTDRYFNYLESFNTKNDSSKAYYYFGRRTIFTKVCPRYVADRLKYAFKEFENQNWKKSLEIYAEILNKTNNYNALIGYAEVQKKLDNTKKGLKKIESNLKDFHKTSFYYNLQFKLADLYILVDNISKADSLYKQIKIAKPNTWLEHLSSLRLLLESKRQLKLYLNGTSTDKLVLLLKLLNKENADIILPVAVRLSIILNIEYDKFTKNFLSDEILMNLKDSYTLNVLSMYMLDNLDFITAEEMINKALLLNTNNELIKSIKSKLRLINWYKENSDHFIEMMKSNL